MSKSDRIGHPSHPSHPGRPGRPIISPEGGSSIALLLTVGLVFAWTAVQLLGPRVAVLAGLKPLVYFLLTTLACTLLGLGLLRRLSGLTRLERLVLGFATGQAILIMLTLALGLLGQVSMIAVLPQVLLVAGLVLAWPWLRAAARGGGEKAAHNTAPDSRGPADGLIVGLIVVLAAIVLWGAWSPCVEYDVLEYHAAVPAEWYRAGGIVNLPHNVYSYFPMGAEMLYLLGISVSGSVGDGGAALGKLLAGSCTVWAALVLISIGRRLFSLRAGLIAAALYLTVPWVFRVSVIGYVEGVQSFYTAAAVLALVGLWQAGRSGKAATGYALLAGVMVGLTLSIKMTNLAFVLPAATIFCLLAVLRQRAGLLPLAVFALAVAVFGSPFYLRNLYLAENPFFPILSQWFGGPAGWTAELGRRFARFHSPGPYSLSALRTALLGRGLSQAHLGPWFFYSGAVLLLVPFALVSPRSRRAAAVLVGLVALTVALWFTMTHRLARLLVPVWTLLALAAGAAGAAGAGMTALRTRPGRWVLGGAVVLHVMMAFSINLQMLQDRGTYLSLLADAEAPLLKDGYRFKYDPATTDDLWTYSPHMVRMINDLKPRPGHRNRVGLIGEARTLYFRVPVVYNTVFNRPWIEPLYGPDPDDGSAWPTSLKERAGRLFSDLGLSYVYVNWIEVNRFSGPGNYGWPKGLDRELLDRLEHQGVLRKLFSLGRPGRPPLHVLYEVVSP